jgi:hypothetical protein
MFIRKVAPPQAETPDTMPLTRLQKTMGICLLLFYLAMIAITIATLPYVDSVTNRISFE